ncbi:MAG: VOC family protein [Chthoniobacter sp.]|nr:VOC family protein [Chthoniobacter sp.]
MKITEIAFSAYPITDVARARGFYEGVLGLTPTQVHDMGEDRCWIEYDIASGTLGLGKYEGWKPSGDGCTVGLEVENFDEAVATIQASGATIKMGPFETPVCHMLMVADPDGNTVIIHKRKPGHH